LKGAHWSAQHRLSVRRYLQATKIIRRGSGW
jgi:hypothetical protein